MWEKVKNKITHASKETIKEEFCKHSDDIIKVTSIVLLVYLCIKTTGKPINVTVNINGGTPIL